MRRVRRPRPTRRCGTFHPHPGGTGSTPSTGSPVGVAADPPLRRGRRVRRPRPTRRCGTFHPHPGGTGSTPSTGSPVGVAADPPLRRGRRVRRPRPAPKCGGFHPHPGGTGSTPSTGSPVGVAADPPLRRGRRVRRPRPAPKCGESHPHPGGTGSTPSTGSPVGVAADPPLRRGRRVRRPRPTRNAERFIRTLEGRVPPRPLHSRSAWQPTLHTGGDGAFGDRALPEMRRVSSAPWRDGFHPVHWIPGRRGSRPSTPAGMLERGITGPRRERGRNPRGRRRPRR
ncbi:hypothetical protein L21SP4_01393 [Kiritimatiella glycovorans]|uniref:Uncharacterized protein n=1 Tax=Kiritimatiella glycovorans TaxID=1307763 RepID=A0A0G3EDV6_9BACT|nr:hypothetical protein L21SP4_01393 [Kiritimatiella glycovorans]